VVCGFVKVIQVASVYGCGVFFLMMWGKHCSFPHKTLWITIVFPYIVFFCYDFLKNYFCRFYFFNIDMVENLDL
jgi:hypothetical protein